MKPIKDFDSVQAAGSFERPAADGYVCMIKKVVDHPDHEYLHIEFDIVEGRWTGYASETAERAGFWPLSTNRFYGAKAIGFFKAFIEAVQNTNKGFVWDWDEKKLVGKGVGIVFRDEEYEAKSGQIRSSIKPYEFMTAAEIREGKFTVPAPLKLNDNAVAAPEAPAEETNYTLPF